MYEKVTPAGLSVERPKNHPDWVSAETVLRHNMSEYRRFAGKSSGLNKEVFEHLSALCAKGLADIQAKSEVKSAIDALDAMINRNEEVTDPDSGAVSIVTLGVGNEERSALINETASLKILRDQLAEFKQ
ncbi:MAG: hypothetical protein ABI747_04480 [Candidatus Moraniibacteriota bacterium]